MGKENHIMTKLISTHTPLARRDDAVMTDRDISADFYSHASREA